MRALRATADRLAAPDARYEWGHMGGCNCGHLAQTVTTLSRAEIHRRAMERAGDWSQQVVDHCPTSGLAIDWVIDRLLELGLSRDDLVRLEKLDDRAVLRRLAAEAGSELLAPPLSLCTDNAAMIAWAGIERLHLGLTDGLDFKARPRWPLEELDPARREIPA